MKGTAIIGLVIIGLFAGETAPAQSPAGTAFTYQGQLKQNGVPVNNPNGRFQFKLFDADTGGNQVGNTVSFTGVDISNGLFTVTLDFGAEAFAADARWLEVGVYESGTGWVTLSPRQQVTPTPYAMTAANLTLPFAATVPETAEDAFTIDYAGCGYAIRATSTGTDAVAIYGSASAYDTVAIHGQATGLVSTAVQGYASATGPEAANVGGWFGAQGEQGKGVYASAMATSGTNYGVYGRTSSPQGYGGYFLGRGYFSGNVGIGVEEPAEKLDVAGLIKTNGFQLATAPTSGYVLTCDAAGVGTWQPAGAGSCLWQLNGSDIYYDAGKVGIGTTTPLVPLQVTDTAGGFAAVAGEKPGESSYGYLGHEFAGVYGLNNAAYSDGKAVYGEATGPGGFGGYFEGRGYFSGNVGIGTQNPSAQLDVVSSNGNTAVNAWNSGENTSGALGHEFAGVYASGPLAAYFEGRGYFSDNVGIGTTPADSALTVAGLIESTSGGIKFPDGTTQTTAATGGGDSFWEAAPDGIRYSEGYVGVGSVSNPSFPLHAASTEQTAIIGVNNFTTTSDGNGILAETSATAASAVYGRNNSATGVNSGILGIAYSPEGDGVRGANLATTGDAIGVNGRSHSTEGIGVYGYATAATGTTYGVYGQAASPNGFGGYFEGKGYFGGSVGIGTTAPSAMLDVAGTVRVDGFRLDAAPADGHVLTSDGLGNASWQAPSYFDLPYSGTVSSGAAAFEVTNTGTSSGTKAIVAIVNNPASSAETTAGYFTASGSNGKAIYARSSAGVAIEASHTGPTYAYYGTSYGAGCANFTCFTEDGFGVKGVASALAGADTVGGWFESASFNGDAVYAHASGAEAQAVFAETDGAQSTAVYATSPYRALYAASPNTAAWVVGDVRVYQYAGSDIVFEVDVDTGMTSVDALHITGGADLAEEFAVSEAVEPGLVVEIDPDHPGQLRIARGAYNRRVAGVISGANDLDVGMVLAELPEAENAQPIALSGRVWVHCDATDHAIAPGDLLTTADRPGHAMAVTDFGRAHGAVLGKAMTALAEGQTGMVLVLVNLQ